MTARTAQQWAAAAAGAAQAGDLERTRRVLAEALAAHPQNPGLWHHAGKLLLQAGEPGPAAEHFTRAFALAPGNVAFAVDRAIALSSAERHREALEVLAAVEGRARGQAAYWSARANAARGVGELHRAAQWYDRALAIEPGRARALHGRATVAIERGEPDAVARFDAALGTDGTNPFLWLGKAQALDVAGDAAAARAIAEQLVRQAPQWNPGMRFLAQLRLAAGENDFTAHYTEAAKNRPADPGIVREQVALLDQHDLHGRALDAVAEARARMPDDPHLALLEAVQAGAAGDDERAERVFAALDLDSAERWLQEARHRLRRGDYDRAERLLDRVLAEDPWHISAWALRDCVWRLAGDPRAAWLHRQPGLVELMPLAEGPAVLAAARPVLHRLHEGSPYPLGQSLRGGTQTRGNLFQRTEPELARLRDALMATLETYRAGLPPADPRHPLLRHRDRPWVITGSWSVRLSGGGDHHTAHLHPQGIVSSALYCELPEDLDDDSERPGWIELGRPARDLGLPLEPIHALQPREGHLALFPSTLYHGTRPFRSGRRMTVAFDVTLADG